MWCEQIGLRPVNIISHHLPDVSVTLVLTRTSSRVWTHEPANQLLRFNLSVWADDTVDMDECKACAWYMSSDI